MLLQELNDRFDQDDLLSPQYLENLLMKAANGDVYEESFEALKSSVYSSDISFEKLHQELPLLVTLIRQLCPLLLR